MRRIRFLVVVGVCAAGSAALGQQEVVFPTGEHRSYNFIPFGSEQTTYHQVFDANLFRSLPGSRRSFRIERLAFASDPLYFGHRWEMPLEVWIGYTDRLPGEPPPAGLDVPSAGTNPKGQMVRFCHKLSFQHTGASTGPSDFDIVYEGHAFDYYPEQGNLLIEIVADGQRGTGSEFLSVSLADGGGESSRAFDTVQFGSAADPGTATRIRFTIGDPRSCYADCDENEVLDFFDFLCFQDRFLAGDPWADCDGCGSLDFFDFLCFMNAFMHGC